MAWSANYDPTRRGTLAALSQQALIDRFTAKLPAAPAVRIGPGDDGAVYLLSGSAVSSTQILVEGVNFRRDWSEPDDVGRKAVAVVVANLEAMAATPVGLHIGFAAPGTLSESWTVGFITGLRFEAERAEVALLGGDLS
jgi:thiamine-monophosphate kinase